MVRRVNWQQTLLAVTILTVDASDCPYLPELPNPDNLWTERTHSALQQIRGRFEQTGTARTTPKGTAC
jgi:hypothetical protein